MDDEVKKKPGRKAASTLRSEVGNSRKAKIAHLLANGFENLTVWAAMEVEYPEIIEDISRRKSVCVEKGIDLVPYDAGEREKMGWAIRQIKGLMKKEQEMAEELSTLNGKPMVKSAADIELTNMRRFKTGIDGFDTLFGRTIFRWLRDAPDSKYFEEVILRNGQEKLRKVWVEGSYKAGDYMPLISKGDQNWTPSDGVWVAKDADAAYCEYGLPYGFLSIFGGEPGVGKSRLLIAVCKALNSLGYKVLYFNGELSETQFRIMTGADIDDELFRVVSSQTLLLEDIVEIIYSEKPAFVIVDSFQMIAEVSEGGTRGAKTALSRFNLLKMDEEAGMPHICFISQLNKKKDLAGSKYIEHMVDFWAKVTKIEGRKTQFLVEVPTKNRAGQTGIGVPFEHTDDGVRDIGSRTRKVPLYKLMQATTSPTIQEGVPPVGG